MKGKFKVLSLLLSLVMVFSLAFNVKAEDVNPPVRISYEIDGEAYEDGYADLAMITFNVETDEGVEISKIDLYEDGELYEEDIDIEDAFDLAYKPETTFQLKVTATDGNVYESELVTIKVYEVTDYDDDDEDEEDDYLFIHNWDFENMEIQEPDDETDGYVRICCLDEGCEEYLQLGITVYDIIKGDNSVFNLNEPKDLTFTVDGDGLLVGAVIGEDMLTEDDYLDNYNGSVTIYKETLKKLDVGTYDIGLVFLDTSALEDYEEVKDLDLAGILSRMKIAIAEGKFTVTKVKITDNKEDKVNEETSDKKDIVNKDIVDTGDDTNIVLYASMGLLMLGALAILKKKKA